MFVSSGIKSCLKNCHAIPLLTIIFVKTLIGIWSIHIIWINIIIKWHNILDDYHIYIETLVKLLAVSTKFLSQNVTFVLVL